MYQNPTLFPQVTNRESWSPIITLFDDDTGDPLNLTYTTGTGTLNSWQVDVAATLQGAVVLSTSSSSTLTIGNGTFAAALPTGLAISAGQYVTFTALGAVPGVMIGRVNSYNSATGALSFTVSTMTVQLEIRRDKFGAGQRGSNEDYIQFFNYGALDDTGPIITLSIGNGITIVDIGTLQIYVSELNMRNLAGRTHIVAAVLTSADNVDARQLFLGKLPVLDGYVSN